MIGVKAITEQTNIDNVGTLIQGQPGYVVGGIIIRSSLFILVHCQVDRHKVMMIWTGSIRQLWRDDRYITIIIHRGTAQQIQTRCIGDGGGCTIKDGTSIMRLTGGDANTIVRCLWSTVPDGWWWGHSQVTDTAWQQRLVVLVVLVTPSIRNLDNDRHGTRRFSYHRFE